MLDRKYRYLLPWFYWDNNCFKQRLPVQDSRCCQGRRPLCALLTGCRLYLLRFCTGVPYLPALHRHLYWQEADYHRKSEGFDWQPSCWKIKTKSYHPHYTLSAWWIAVMIIPQVHYSVTCSYPSYSGLEPVRQRNLKMVLKVLLKWTR